MKKRLVIIGAGPAGVEAALSAAPHAQNVVLVSAGPVADWSQLLSSRIWLQTLERRINAAASVEFDLLELGAEVRAVAETWTAKQLSCLRAAQVELVEGQAAFVDPDRVQVGNRTIDADAVIIASGTAPVFPPGFEPDGQRVFSPQTIDAMEKLPQSLLLVGDGPIGFEYAHLFSLLGVEITWLVLEGGPASTFGAAIDAHLLAPLQARGVKIHPGPVLADVQRRTDGVTATRKDGQRFSAEALFINIGFRAALAALDVAKAGLDLDERGGLPADDYGQTAVSSIYSTAYPGTVSLARARGRIAARHALGQSVEPFDPSAIVVPFHLCPQVARVGQLAAADDSIQTVDVPFADLLKPHLIGRADGFLTLAWDQERRITGAMAVGEQAADALTPVGLGIKMNATIDDLAGLYGPHPTVSELPFAAARRAVEQTDA